MKKNHRVLIKAFVIIAFTAGFQLAIAQENLHSIVSLNTKYPTTEIFNALGQISVTNENTVQPWQQSINRNHLPWQSSNRAQYLIDEWFLMDTVFSPVTPEERQRFPEMAFGTSCYLAVWQDNRSGDFYNYDWDVYAARITPDGEVLDPYGIKISGTPGNAAQEPSVAFDGTNFLVIWSENRDSPTDFDIFGARVSQDGEVLDPDGIEICNEYDYQILTGIAFNGTHYLASWSDFRPGNHDIYGARIDPDGTVLEPGGFPIYSAPNNQAYVSVASDGSGWFLTWGALYETVIRGTRVAADGSVLDPDGFTISADLDFRFWPDADFDGTNYMVVWSDRRSGTAAANWSVYGSRITPDGVVLDPDGIPIAADDSKYEGMPELCFDGTNYLVVWKDDGYAELAGTLLGPDGTIQSPGEFTLTGAPGNETYHAIAHDGNNWCMTWCDYRSSSWDDIFGARIDPSGNVLDPYPDDLVVIQSASYQYSPDAAYDGTNHMVVWQDRVAPDHYGIVGTRVAEDGTPLDSPVLNLSTYPSNQDDPDIAFGNSVYLAVWKDYRNTVFGSIFGSRVSEDGTVLDPDNIVISDGTSGKRLPAVAFDGTNFLVIWWEYGSDFQYHVYGCRVSEEGVVLDPVQIDISGGIITDYGWNYFVDLSVAFDGENFLVTWVEFVTDSWDIAGARVTPDGEVLDIGGFPISSYDGDQAYPNVTTSGGQCMVTWIDERFGGPDIFGARVDPSGAVLDPDGIQICVNGSDQSGVNVGFDGHHYVVVWTDYRHGLSDSYGTPVDLDGNVMEQNGIAFSLDPYSERGPKVSGGSDGESLVFLSNFEPITYQSSRIWGGVYLNPHTGINDPGYQGRANKQLSNAPNPFNTTTKITFDLPNTAYVHLEVYDLSGRHVSTIHNGMLPAGHHKVIWNGCDDHGRALRNGIYLCRFSGDGLEETLKMTLLR